MDFWDRYSRLRIVAGDTGEIVEEDRIATTEVALRVCKKHGHLPGMGTAPRVFEHVLIAHATRR